MTRREALEIAARILGNLSLVKKNRNFRDYQNDLNYLADCIMMAAAGEKREREYQHQ